MSKFCLALFLILMAAPSARPAVAAQSLKVVLALYSEERSLPANIAIETGLRQVLATNSSTELTFLSEYLDEPRFDEIGYDKLMNDFLRAKYARQHIDAIVAVGPEALMFLQSHRAQLFSGIPVVVCEVDPDVYASQPRPPGYLDVPLVLDQLGTLDLAMRLQPDAAQIVLMTGNSERGRRWKARFQRAIAGWKSHPPIRYLDGLTPDAFLRELASLPRNSIVYGGGISRDSTDQTYISREVWQHMAEVSAAPVYNSYSTLTGYGVVGGDVYDLTGLGQQTGEVVRRILNGEKLTQRDMPASVPLHYVVDWRQLQRWHMSERNLPPGTVVMYREPSVWMLYRSYILIAVLFLLVETALMAALLVERRKTRQAKMLLERRLGIENLISERSTRLSNCAAEQVEDEIVSALRAILHIEGADRASWFVIDGSGAGVHNIYSVHSLGTEATPEFITRPELPWVTETLLRSVPVVLSQMDDLPPEAEVDRAYFEQRHIKSLALVPSSPADSSRGVLVVVCSTNERTWSEHLVNRMGVLGNIFANALARKQAQEDKQESERRFRCLVEEAPIGIALEDLNGKILFSNPALSSMLGYTMEEMATMDCSQFADAAGGPGDSDQFQEMQSGLRDGYRVEKCYARKDGLKIWANLNVSLLKGSGATLVLATVEDISEKKAAVESLTSAHTELQQLTLRLLQTQEDERQRIARDLHDDVGQRLSLIMLDLDLLNNEMPAEQTTEHEKLRSLLGQVDELVTDVHNMSHQLHSSKLKHLGLSVALKEVCHQVSRQHRVEIKLHADQMPHLLPEQVSLCLYRVAQEALQNAVKHSRAERIEVTLTNDGSVVRLQITDFGVGFDSKIRNSGLGLVTMQERLRMIDGRLRVESEPGTGTRIVAEADIDCQSVFSEDSLTYPSQVSL